MTISNGELIGIQDIVIPVACLYMTVWSLPKFWKLFVVIDEEKIILDKMILPGKDTIYYKDIKRVQKNSYMITIVNKQDKQFGIMLSYLAEKERKKFVDEISRNTQSDVKLTRRP